MLVYKNYVNAIAASLSLAPGCSLVGDVAMWSSATYSIHHPCDAFYIKYISGMRTVVNCFVSKQQLGFAPKRLRGEATHLL